jgi:predicted  nucleic acid-binding Zn-ribbon protein
MNNILEDTIITLSKKLEELESANKQYLDTIQKMNYKIAELERKQKDEPEFIVYLKKLFAWN